MADAGEIAVNLNFTLSSGIKNLKEPGFNRKFMPDGCKTWMGVLAFHNNNYKEVIRKISSVRVNKSFKATFKYLFMLDGGEDVDKEAAGCWGCPSTPSGVSSSSLKKNVIILVP